jgi:hypothetical protein
MVSSAMLRAGNPLVVMSADWNHSGMPTRPGALGIGTGIALTRLDIETAYPYEISCAGSTTNKPIALVKLTLAGKP